MATAIKGFGDRLTKARMNKDWTQKKLIESLGSKSAKSVCHWESGRRAPRMEQLAAICVALNVSADWLLGIERTGE